MGMASSLPFSLCDQNLNLLDIQAVGTHNVNGYDTMQIALSVIDADHSFPALRADHFNSH